MIAAALLACAANVAPITLQAVIEVESGGNPLALHVNGIEAQPVASDVAQAVQLAESYIAHGYSVDLGLMQVNSRNLRALGVGVFQAFNPCTNISAGATILSADYANASRLRGPGQAALRAALSAYNTGDFYRGFENGYVARYYGEWAFVSRAVGARAQRPAATAIPNSFKAATSIYSRVTLNVRIAD